MNEASKPGAHVTRTCPACGLEQPVLRAPTTMRELVHGGWTCRGCGAEMDRDGRKLDT